MTKTRVLKPQVIRGLRSRVHGPSKADHQRHNRHEDTRKARVSAGSRIQKPPAKAPNAKEKLPLRKSVAAPRLRRQKSPDGRDGDRSGEMIHSLKIPASKMSKWKPVSKDMVKFISETLDANINQILSRTRGLSAEPVQQCLNSLRDQVQIKMQRLKVPTARYGSYSKVQALKADVERLVQEKNSCLEELDTEMERYEKLIEQLEEEKIKLERQMQTDHESLGEDSPAQATDALGLPPLPAGGATLFGLETAGARCKVANNDQEIMEGLNHLHKLS